MTLRKPLLNFRRLAVAGAFALSSLQGQLPDATPASPPASAAPKEPPKNVLIDLPELRAQLGPLADQLQACLPMDNAKRGALAYFRALGDLRLPPLPPEPLAGLLTRFVGGVRFGEDQGRSCADFSESGSALITTNSWPVLREYTLCGWMKFPAPQEACMVWQCSGGIPLAILNRRFVCVPDLIPRSAQRGSAGQTAQIPVDLGSINGLTGWHHLAVTSDESRVTFFLDGVRQASVPATVNLSHLVTGGGKLPATVSALYATKPLQCGPLDDVFIFTGTFGEKEIRQVLPIRIPAGFATVQPLAANPALSKAGSPAHADGTPAPAAPLAAPAVDPSVQSTAAELLKKDSSMLIFVTGAQGAGSGFAGRLGGAEFVFTNAHVAAGVRGGVYQTLEGMPIQAAVPMVAAGHDIFRMTLRAGTPALEVMQNVGQNSAIGDDVVVLGNAEGGGVINTILGKIVGIGPDRVEVDAPFQPGNSGSPIIHLKSGKVIGVATYLTIKKYDSATKEVLKNPVVRRFGFRLDSVKTWEPVNWQAFYAQAVELESIEKLTEDFGRFLNDLAKDSRVTAGVHTNPAIKVRIDQWLEVKKKHLTARDAAQIDQNFIAFLKVAARTDIAAAQPRMSYDYFQKQLATQQQERAEITEIFDKIIREIQAQR